MLELAEGRDVLDLVVRDGVGVDAVLALGLLDRDLALGLVRGEQQLARELHDVEERHAERLQVEHVDLEEVDARHALGLGDDDGVRH